MCEASRGRQLRLIRAETDSGRATAAAVAARTEREQRAAVDALMPFNLRASERRATPTSSRREERERERSWRDLLCTREAEARVGSRLMIASVVSRKSSLLRAIMRERWLLMRFFFEGYGESWCRGLGFSVRCLC